MTTQTEKTGTTHKTFFLGQTVFLAEGEWANGRPIDDLGEVRATAAEAREDADTRFGWLSADEQSRVLSLRVRAYEITAIDEDGGVGGMVSRDVVMEIV